MSEGTRQHTEGPADASEPPDDELWSAPGYHVVQPLGRGAAGRVVAAVNKATGERVAIMYFDSEEDLNDNDFLDGLRSHAEQMKSLDSTHVARIRDFVEEPGRGAAIVIALVDGVSLRDILTHGGPLGPEAALVMLRDSLLGLAAAHSLPLPHGDHLRPDNVLIDANGSCMLTGVDLTMKTGKAIPAEGMAPYMAPELQFGAPASPTTDIYAATAVLWESVTGRPPFSEAPRDERRGRKSGPGQLDWVDNAIQGLIASGMAKHPADRPQSARSFIHDLEAAATDAYGQDWSERGRIALGERAAALLPESAGGGSAAVKAARRRRRKPVRFPPAVIAAAVGLVVIVVAAMALPAVFKSGKSGSQLSLVVPAAEAAQVIVSPPVAASTCATPSTFTYTGTVTAEEPGTLIYEWVYSSGPGAAQSVYFAAAGTRQVNGGTVSATASGEGWGEIKLLGGAGKVSNRASYQLDCSTVKSGVTLAASVQPKTQTVGSCADTPPPLTATGSIDSKKAGTLRYYWALANGQRSAVRTLVFKAAGTMSVPPLKIQPAALPASGEAVLVVTSPVAAASQPATYKVACTAPIVITPPPAEAQPTSGTQPTSGGGGGTKSTAPTGGKTSSAPTHSATKGPTTAPPTTAPPTTAPPTTAPPTTAPPTTAPPTSSTPSGEPSSS